jgi:CPA1 family monovalent cation:H+ antiporter
MSAILLAAESSEIEVTETLVVGVMLVAALVGIAVSRLRLPYTVALVLVGLALSLFGVFQSINLTDELILLVFLPPLLFEGAINMDLDDLVRRWHQVGLLAFVGTAISAGVIAAALAWVPGMSFELAVVLAVILAATDPVSVLAIFKEHGVGTGLRTLMEGESIFNDALAIVLYLIAVEVAFGEETVTFQDAVVEFGTEVVVGTAVGLLVGFAAHRLMSALDDHLVEIMLSLVTGYGAYLVADRLHGSGVIAVVVAGLLIGNYGTRLAMSASSRVALINFWEVLTFLANSALFLLMGLAFNIGELRGRTLVATVSAIVAVLVGRALIAYGLLRLFGRSRAAPVPPAWRTAVFWGGLRGSIPVALVLGLDDPVFAGINAVTVVFAVVMFSLIVQGLTYKPVLDRLGLTSKSDEITHYEELLAETVVMRAARRELEAMRATGEIVPALFDDLRLDIEDRSRAAEEELATLTADADAVRRRQITRVARRLASAQKQALSEAARSGRIGEHVARSKSKAIEVAYEEGEITRLQDGTLDPVLYPDELGEV